MNLNSEPLCCWGSDVLHTLGRCFMTGDLVSRNINGNASNVHEGVLYSAITKHIEIDLLNASTNGLNIKHSVLTQVIFNGISYDKSRFICLRKPYRI